MDITDHINNYRFNLAAERLYEFIWHELADLYIEYVKVSDDKRNSVAALYFVFKDCLKLLHPFMPFVTEEIYKRLYSDIEIGKEKLLITSSWPDSPRKMVRE